MVKHIVMFRLLPTMDNESKNKVMNGFKAAIEALPSQIPSIRKIEVGLNVNGSEDYDIVLYSEFDTLEDVRKYAVHPAHVDAAKLLKDVKESRACVDYEC